METGRDKAALILRLRLMGVMEILNGVLIIPLFLAALHRANPLGALTVYAMGVLALILGAGGMFWWLSARDLAGRTRRLAGWRPVFAAFRRLYPVLLLVSVPLIGTGLAAGRGADRIAAAFVYAFAVLEYVNYFHVQLMYDNASDWAYVRTHRRLKRAALARWLDG